MNQRKAIRKKKVQIRKIAKKEMIKKTKRRKKASIKLR